jgi:phosphate transport system protein
MERIGDLATNIAERALFLNTHARISIPFDFQRLTERTRWMLRSSLDSLVNMDTHLAHEICRTDDEVDAINREMYDLVTVDMRKNPELMHMLIPYISISRYLERIADHATNIAEDVIYMVDGIIARHRAEGLMPKSE